MHPTSSVYAHLYASLLTGEDPVGHY